MKTLFAIFLTVLLPAAIAQAQPTANFITGALLQETWLNISGHNVADLTNSPSFRKPPNRVSLVSQFEIPSDATVNYGVRLSGYLHVPVSGSYVFYISSNEQGGLFLSSDDNPENKRRIAFEPLNQNATRAWTGTADGRRNADNPENISEPISLLAGR